MYELLKSKPERERELLSALVNKLGDPERKARASLFRLCEPLQLLQLIW